MVFLSYQHSSCDSSLLNKQNKKKLRFQQKFEWIGTISSVTFICDNYLPYLSSLVRLLTLVKF